MLVMAGCVVSRSGNAPRRFRRTSTVPEQLSLRTFGDAGQAFEGVLVVDGERRDVSEVSPAEFPLTASVVAGEFIRTGGGGIFEFRIYRDKGSVGFGGLSEPGRSVRFRYHNGAIEVSSDISLDDGG